jgi:hypothetical protein
MPENNFELDQYPKALQTEIVARTFNSASDFKQFMEDYEEAKLISGPRLVHVEARIPNRYWDWLEMFESGMSINDIAKEVGANTSVVGNCIKKAALLKAIGKERKCQK